MPASILPDRRRAALSERLKRGQSLSATLLAREFFVSEDAIRRDLRDLARSGLCKRVYGGAVPIGIAKPIDLRRTELGAAKRRLAEAAVGLITPGATIFLDTGSTHEVLAQLLPADAGLTVVTHAPTIAVAVLARPGCSLLMLGGKVSREIGASIGANALRALCDVRCDLGFIGVCGFSIEDGATAYDSDDAEFKREASARCRRIAALLPAHKLMERAPYRSLAAEEFSDLVFDYDADPETVEKASSFATVIATKYSR